MDWDDLRYFLAVVRSGSVSGAARALGVNHSTVSRRVSAFEEALGVRLLERLPRGWTTTVAGEDMYRTALEMEREIQSLDRRILGRDARLSGKIRVAIPDVLTSQLAPLFAEFAAQHPEIELEIIGGDEYVNLGRREADVAIRGSAERPESLTGRRLGDVGVAIYGARRYLAAHAGLQSLDEHSWIGWDEDWARRIGHEPVMLATRWMREHVPDAHVTCRVNAASVLFEVVRAGMGLGLLPCFAGDLDPGLERVPPGLVDYELGLWALTHPDLRTTARVHRFLDFLAEAVGRQADLIAGRLPAASPPARPPRGSRRRRDGATRSA